jgi:Family of unknown function (DUF6263)
MRISFVRNFVGCIACFICLSLLATAAAAQNATKLEWKLKKGQKINSSIVQDVEADMELGGMEININMKFSADSTWTVDEVVDGGYKVTQKFDRITMKAALPFADEIDFDSSKADDADADEDVVEALTQLIGAEIKSKMSVQGKFSDVEFPEGFMESIQGNQQLAQMIQEDSLKGLLGQGICVLSEDEVADGATWSDEDEAKNPMGVTKTKTTYTFAGIEKVDGKELAKIETKSEIEIQAQGGFPGKLELKEQDVSGTVYFDVSEGVPTESTGKQKMKMEITAQGQKIVQNIESTNTAKISVGK